MSTEYLYKSMTKEEEQEFYLETLNRVIANPRYYLDHLDDGTLEVYRLRNKGFINKTTNIHIVL